MPRSARCATPGSSLADLEIRTEGGALWVTLNRPEVFNALTESMADDLAAVIERATADDDVRVVVLTGAGAAFSAGADISGTDAHEHFDVSTLDRANRIIRAITTLDKPVVAAVNGIAAGVGCSAALAADLAIARESASFLLAFARIGLMPDGGSTATVAASIGRARAMRMALLAEPLSAREAYDAGLIAEVARRRRVRRHRRPRRTTSGERAAAGVRRHQEGDQRRDPHRARRRAGARADRPDRAAAHRRRGRGDARVRRAATADLPRRVDHSPRTP